MGVVGATKHVLQPIAPSHQWVKSVINTYKLFSGSLTRKEVFADCQKFNSFWSNRHIADVPISSSSPVKDKRYVHEAGYTYKNTLRYRLRESVAFLISQGPSTYATTLRVLNELKMRDPSFAPKSIVDFGSGTGTSSWVASDMWEESVKDLNLLDVSQDMHDIAEHLLAQKFDEIDEVTKKKQLNPNAPRRRFRNFFPIHEEETFDLSLSVHTLSELKDARARKRALRRLWAHTNDYLVIVEHGSPFGYGVVLEARDYLLHHVQADVEWHSSQKQSAHEEEEEMETIENVQVDGDQSGDVVDSDVLTGTNNIVAEIVGPCPHIDVCPMFETSKPCHFPLSLLWPMDLAYSKFLQHNHVQRPKFSYLIVKKSHRDSPTAGVPHCSQPAFKEPRIVAPPRKKKGFIMFPTCSPTGTLRDESRSKVKHGSVVWTDSKDRKWGDCIPDASTVSSDNHDGDAE
eukprot:m.8470 g.8470  ORF g.8470 m.8470 type:complete len:458 (-) comp6102_c0_seq1:210-1583(-)